jgi:hypothetical protein
MSGVVDREYMNALRSAAPVFRKIAAELRKEAEGGRTADLINYLRSGAELDRAEREELADLIAGEFSRRPGRPQLYSDQKQWRTAVCQRVFALEARWRKEGRKWPFRAESAKLISQEICRGPKVQRAQPEEIIRWLDRLPKAKRDFLKDNCSE